MIKWKKIWVDEMISDWKFRVLSIVHTKMHIFLFLWNVTLFFCENVTKTYSLFETNLNLTKFSWTLYCIILLLWTQQLCTWSTVFFSRGESCGQSDFPFLSLSNYKDSNDKKITKRWNIKEYKLGSLFISKHLPYCSLMFSTWYKNNGIFL